MGNLQEIESAVSQLSTDDLAAFRDWFAQFDAQQWDGQFEKDVAAGRFDSLAAKAIETSKTTQTIIFFGF